MFVLLRYMWRREQYKIFKSLPRINKGEVSLVVLRYICCSQQNKILNFAIADIVCFLISITELHQSLWIRKRYIVPHVKSFIFLSHVNQVWVFATDMNRSPQYLFPQKSLQWETSCAMWSEGRTDGWLCRHDEVSLAFRNLARATIGECCIFR